MAITKNQARQEPIVAFVDVSLADLVGGYVTPADDVTHLADLTSTVAHTTSLTLHVGAVVVGGSVTVEEAFNSTSTDVIVVGDVTVTNRYVASTTVHAKGVIQFVPTGFIHTATESAIKIIWTSGGGTPTTGRLRIAVQYYVVADVVTKTQTVAYTDLTSGAAFASSMTLPVDSVVIGGSVAVVTPFNSVTSDVVVVGDVTTADRYVASTTIHTGASTPIPFVPTGFVNTATQDKIKFTWTQVGGSTSAGVLTISVTYYVLQNLPAIRLPANSVVLSGDVVVSTALNSGTSDSLIVGDAASTARYKSSFSIASTGRTALVPTGDINTDRTDVTMRWLRLGATAPTVGALRLILKYFVKGRSEYMQD